MKFHHTDLFLSNQTRRFQMKQLHIAAHLNCIMRKPTLCICENKGTDQLRSHCKADHTFVSATWIVKFLYFLNPKFPVSSHLQCLYSSVCVVPGLKLKLLIFSCQGSNVKSCTLKMTKLTFFSTEWISQ